MSKINFEDIQENYNTALTEKEVNSQDVVTAIIDNDLTDKFNLIQKEKDQINSIEELYNYQKKIKSFFDDVYKIITAPGVQKFIDWLDELSSKSLETKTRKYITEFLIKEYASYDESIKNIIINKKVIEANGSLFENVKKSVKENINKRIVSSFASSDKTQEDFPDFIEELNDLLEGLSEIEELGFENIKDFYTSNLDEKDNDEYIAETDKEADYFYDLIKQVVEKKDFLTTDKDKIQLTTIVVSVQSSIDDIKNSIEMIKTIGVSNDSEIDIITLYNKFEKSFKFNNVDNVSEYIQESINDTWEKIIKAYSTCQSFYAAFGSSKVIKLKSRKERWLNFEFANRIDNYISNLETINTDNPSDSLKTDDITKIKSSFVKTANKIGTLADDNPKETIVNYFSNITSDFENKKTGILKKLKIDDSEIEKIESAVAEINSFIENITNSENLLDALNDDFVDGILSSYDYIKKEFTSAIEKSDIKEDLEYLDKISSDEYVLSKLDLENNLERFKRLLEYDLININLTKNI
ncbi:hypothetical protein [uncultured Lutibacter sp.]|uniref:hypothetical protein n=1 Tax=uncultured Lutibacter sp. TaxID=437739 RepID=UPI002609D01A|nr:hypothetical protein [uncultured Lutibacter sp.]